MESKKPIIEIKSLTKIFTSKDKEVRALERLFRFYDLT